MVSEMRLMVKITAIPPISATSQNGVTNPKICSHGYSGDLKPGS